MWGGEEGYWKGDGGAIGNPYPVALLAERLLGHEP